MAVYLARGIGSLTLAAYGSLCYDFISHATISKQTDCKVLKIDGIDCIPLSVYDLLNEKLRLSLKRYQSEVKSPEFALSVLWGILRLSDSLLSYPERIDEFLIPARL